MRRFGLGAIALLALGWLSLMQAPGANQNAHFALVRSLADGSPRIDRYRNETGDTAYVDGHYYAAKAPGLALATVPWYLGLRAAGVANSNASRFDNARSWPGLQSGFCVDYRCGVT